MADSSSEHLIRIIVQGVNRLGDIVEKGTRAVEKHTGAVERQGEAIEKTARTAKDVQTDFENFTKSVRDGARDYDEARFGLENLSKELDRLARREPVGSKLSEDLHRSALAAKALSEQLRLAHEAERRVAEQEAKDRVRREEERQRLAIDTAKKEVEAERKSSEQRKSLVEELLDEVRRDHEERVKLDKVLGDVEVAERIRVETERQRIAAEADRVERTAEEQAAKRRRSFLEEILDEVQRDHDAQVKLAKDLDEQDAKDHQARVKRRIDEAVEHSTAAAARTPTPLGRGVRVENPILGQNVEIERDTSVRGRLRSLISGEASVRRDLAGSLDDVSRSSRSAESGLSRVDRVIQRLSGSSDGAGFSIARVDNNLRGLVIVGVVAFSQQLISAFVALAAAALAVASAAAQAGAAVGGAFVAATGQAIPAIGLLIAAFGRIGAVFDAVQLFNDQATRSGYDQAQAADAQAAAADRVTNAQEGVAAAAQRVKDATNALTEAREQARRKIEDLNLAERNASLSQFESGQAIQRAIAAGDVGALEGLRNQRDEANISVGRTSADAASARTAGVDRAPEVLAAAQTLDAANAALRRSRRELDAAGRSATRAADVGSAADRALEQALAQLTASELALYEASKRIQKRFRDLYRPVTDIIVGAFTRGVDGATKVLSDQRVLGTATRLADAIAESFDRITKEATSDRALNFFKIMGDESAKNIPLLTTLAIRVQRIVAAIAVAGGPALRKFIQFFVDLAGKGEAATNSRSGIARLERFFLRGEVMAESFLKLGGAIIGLFAALAGAGGAEEGIDLVDGLTASIQRATRWVQDHQEKVAQFFSDTADSARVIAGAIFEVARALVGLFSAEKVEAFANAFTRVLLPALVTTAEALGTITYLVTKFLSLPVVSEISSWVLAVGLIFKAFSVFGKLLLPMAGGLRALIGPMKFIGPLATRLAFAMRAAAVILMGPWGLAIAAVITALVLLDKKFHFIGSTLKAIGSAFSFFSGHASKAIDGVRAAEEKLASAQRRSAAAQRDLTDARRAATRNLNDLEASIRGSKLDVRQARFGVRDAEKDLSALRANGAPKEEIAKADLALDQARENLRRTTVSATRAEQDYREEKRKNAEPDSDLSKATRKARGLREEEIKAGRGVGEAFSRAVREEERSGVIDRSAKRMDILKDRLSKLRVGSDEYRQTVIKMRREQKRLSDDLEDLDDNSRKGGRGVRVIGRAALSAAAMFDEAGDRIAKGFNSLAKQLGGVKEVKYSTSGTTTSFGDGTDIKVDSGNILAGRETGGWINRKGGPQGPDNRVIRVGDGEAVLAVPHQPLVDRALNFTSRFMGGPGSLDQLFSSVKGYVGAYATGGRVANFGGHPTNVNPFVKRLIALMQGRFPLSVTSTTDHSRNTTSGNLSDHPGGNAVDLSGAAAVMHRAAEYVKSSGLYKSLKQGIHNPNLAVNRGVLQKPPGQFAGAVWAQHADHLHLAISQAIGKITGGAGGSGSIRAPRISGPEGRLRNLINRAVRRVTNAANRKLDSADQQGATGTLGGLGATKAQGADVDVVAAFKRAASAARATGVERLALFMAGIVESGLRNLPYGDRDSVGALQQRPSQGWTGLQNPFRAALEFLSRAKALRPWRGSAGSLAQAVQRSAFPARYDAVADRARQYLERGGPVWGRGEKPAMLHGGEHVWTAAEVMRAGGHKIMFALRKMLGGGGQGKDGSFKDGGSVDKVGLKRDSRLGTFEFGFGLDGVLDDLSTLRGSIRKLRTRGSKFVTDFGRSIRQMTDENGLLDQATKALDAVVAASARRLKTLAFRVDRSGTVIRRRTARDEAEAQIPGIDRQLRGLRRIRGSVDSSLDDVNHRLAVLRRGGVTSGERKTFETLTAARTSLVARLEGIDSSIADAVEARFQAQETLLQATIEEINTRASTVLRRSDLLDRVAAWTESFVNGSATAFNIRGQALQNRGQALTQQRDALLPLLQQAGAQGNTGLVNDLVAQIEDLNVSIAENTSAITQNTVAARQAAIEAISRTAQRASTRADLSDRFASLVEAGGNSAGAFSLRGNTLLDRRGSITSQRDALVGQLAAAQNSFGGTTAELQQIEDLIDTIDDLNIQLLENAQATEANTIAARQAAIDAITGRGGFLGGVFGGLSGIVKSLGALVGKEDVERIRELAAAAGLVLAQTGAGLRGELLAAFGIDLRGLDPSALVNALSGLNFDAITANFSVAQKQQFEALINAIIDNAGAVVDNTQQLADINGSTQQSFSSTAWQLFREAIFNGSGGLLPQYHLPMSTAQSSVTGASSASSTMIGARSSAPVAGGDQTVVVQVTNPTETTDPDWIGEVLAVKRPLARATQ